MDRQAESLTRLERFDDAVSVHEQIVHRFGDRADPECRGRVMRALVEQGAALLELGRYANAVEACQEFIRRYAQHPDDELRTWVASALAYQSGALLELGHLQQAVAVCQALINRFGTEPELRIRQCCDSALEYRGVALNLLGRAEEALAVCQQIADHYGDDSDDTMREKVGAAQLAEGVAHSMSLLERGHFEDAFLAGQDFIDRCDETASLDKVVHVAEALLVQATALRHLQRYAESLAVYERITDRYVDRNEPWLRVLAVSAQLNRGVTLAEMGRRDEAADVYRQVIRVCHGDAALNTLMQQAEHALRGVSDGHSTG